MCHLNHSHSVHCSHCDRVLEYACKDKISCPHARQCGVKCPDEDCTMIYSKGGRMKRIEGWVFCGVCNPPKQEIKGGVEDSVEQGERAENVAESVGEVGGVAEAEGGRKRVDVQTTARKLFGLLMEQKLQREIRKSAGEDGA